MTEERSSIRVRFGLWDRFYFEDFRRRFIREYEYEMVSKGLLFTVVRVTGSRTDIDLAASSIEDLMGWKVFRD